MTDYNPKDEEMIVVEVPHLMPGSAWIAYSKQDLIDTAYRQAERSGNCVWEKTTAAEILEQGFICGQNATEQEIEEEDAQWLFDLAKEHGWDKPLYRSYTNGGGDDYTTDELDEFDCAVEYLGHDLSGFMVITKEEFEEGRLNWFSQQRYGRGGPGKAVAEAEYHARQLGWIKEESDEEDDEE